MLETLTDDTSDSNFESEHATSCSAAQCDRNTTINQCDSSTIISVCSSPPGNQCRIFIVNTTQHSILQLTCTYLVDLAAILFTRSLRPV